MINYHVGTLPNGLRVVSAPNSQTEAVTILILVGIGGRFEGDKQKGISHFLEHLFFKGSKSRPSTFEISKELDSIGANYNAFTGEEYTGFYVQSSAGDFDRAFDVISDMFINPLFDKDEIEREKGVILQESNMYHDMPQMYVQIMNQKQMFGAHPLGFDLVGDSEHIKATTREDIVAYHDQNYSPENTIIVISGNLENLNLKQKISEKFGKKMPNSPTETQPYRLRPVASALVEEQRQVDQTHLALSFISLSKSDEQKYTLTLLSSLLGGAMSSRLFMEIREKRGLAYYVRSSNTSYADTGIFSILSGVKPESLSEVVQIILKETDDLKKNGPSEEELERAKGNIRGSLAISLEDSLEIASFAAEDMLYFGKIRSISEIIDRINAVTREDIAKLCREIFTKERMGLSIIGPKSYNNDLKEII